MRAFVLIWFGQLISVIGTSMSQFALTIWAYQLTGQATALALVGFCSYAPVVIFSPIAGVLVDRWNRKLVTLLSDLGSGIILTVLLFLYLGGHLDIWILCVTGALTGFFGAFQFPAFSAAVTTMVPKEQYARTSALLGLNESASAIVGPLLAGVLLAFIGLGGILVIDAVTFAVAVLTIAVAYIPQPKVSETGRSAQGSFWRETLYGFQYIWDRKSLLGVQTTFSISNFFFAVGMVLVVPMILSRTDNNQLAVGAVQSAMGVGGVVGGLVLTMWGGPKRRIHGVLTGFIGSSLLGQTLMGMGQTLPIWMLAAFLGFFLMPFINASNQAIWQAKVPPDVQGRVFATRRLIAQITGPIGMLIAGPLADQVFGPAMMPGGALAPAFGWLVGVGPGAGMALMMVIVGILGASAGVVGYAVPVIRNVEALMPDQEEYGAPEPMPAAAA